jgi:hypothetical protein
MKIERVALRLDERSTSNKIEYARNAVIKTGLNSLFSSLSGLTASITTAANALETAYMAAIDGGKTNTSIMNQKEDALDLLLSQLGNNVAAIANAATATGGDAQSIILSAGLDFARPKNKAPLPLATGSLTGVSTLEGEVGLKWKSVKYARAYVIEISSDVTAITSGGATTTPTTESSARVFISWDIADVSTKVKCTITGLSSGTKYAFRVYAIGTAGKGAVSVPVVVKVL